MLRVYFNGKFYGAGLNGVHRVADSLIQAVDRRLSATPVAARPFEAIVIAPEHGDWTPALDAIAVQTTKRADALWEQVALPRLTGDGVLVNLCNLAPIAHRRKLTMIHDVQFYFSSASYPLKRKLYYQTMIPLVAKTSRRVLTVSEYSREMLALMNVVERNRCVVMPNGVDHVIERDAALSADAAFGLQPNAYCVMFASYKEYKNNRVVFDAFREPALRDVALLLVGDGRETLVAAGLEPPPNAVFAGKIDDAELKGVLQNAIALTFPSRTEGFGLPPLEAMAAGAPAIVSPCGAVPEVCRDAAVYADVDDAASWADAIVRLRDDADFRAEKTRKGAARCKDFTWARAGGILWDEILAAGGD
ncbi:MAG: glycosyltransferase family 1 protein [Pseudomonadota bacterium]